MKPIYFSALFLLLAASCNKGTVDPEPKPGDPADSTTRLKLEKLSGNYRLRVDCSFEWYNIPDTARSYKRSFDTVVNWVFRDSSAIIRLRGAGPDSLRLNTVTDSLLVFKFETRAPVKYKELKYYRKTDRISFSTQEFEGHGYKETWSVSGVKD